ncbi:3829_t:CDS:2 [Acaulospora morrowiae]|uniref:3829_t:CDS:1 n=1 Tax=Acaulospora morrowiae TaxID=94023 RepID=A0A9N8VR09_9GLOM|nr:3829_t:CDS:2 [Acaulospora morrowiae]
MQSTLLRLRKELLNLARDRLLAVQQEEKMEASEDIEQIIIAGNVSLEAYIKFCKTVQKLPVNIRFVDGKVVAYEVPLANHGKVSGMITFLIRTWNHQLFSITREDLIVSQSSYLTADVTFRPLDLPPSPAGQELNSDGGAYPTMVVEVGNSESLPSLHRRYKGNACTALPTYKPKFIDCIFLLLNFSTVLLLVEQLMGFIWTYGNYKM